MADPTSTPKFERRSRGTAQPVLRLARLVPTPAAMAAAVRDGEVVLEVGGSRLTIGRGADLATVVTLVSMIGGRP